MPVLWCGRVKEKEFIKVHSCEKYWECSQCSLELAVVKLHRGSVSLGPGITRCSKERVSFFFL